MVKELFVVTLAFFQILSHLFIFKLQSCNLLFQVCDIAILVHLLELNEFTAIFHEG